MICTIQQIIQDALPYIGLPRSPVQTDVLDVALAIVNVEAEDIFNALDWVNARMDVFTVTPDENGIITFTTDVDVIRAVRSIDSDNANSGTPIFNEDEILASSQGAGISSSAFQYLADDASGCRRIKVSTEDTPASYAVLALKRLTKYTTANYTTATFPIDRAVGVLQKKVINALRGWQGLTPVHDARGSLLVAVNREKGLTQTQERFVPQSPMFGEAGCLQ